MSPQKSKAIFNLSKILIDKYNSIVPSNFDDLESLPGVGHKTASVVMCQAFNIPAFPVDTHIYRLLRRWGISKGKSIQKVEKDGKRFFPKELWSKLHLQIIFLEENIAQLDHIVLIIVQFVALLIRSKLM